MAGTKRTHDTMNSNVGNSNPGPGTVQQPESSSPYIAMFDNFRAELDEHHDRRERVMKASKDITANSKKIIFALQRVKTLNQPVSDHRVKTDVTRLLKSTADLFAAVGPDLTSLNTYRYQRNISGGMQEYMEAVLFRHYLEHQRLMTYEEAQAAVPGGGGGGGGGGDGGDDSGQVVLLTHEDYLLGVFDVTGEMMRFAITQLATTGRVPDGSGGGDEKAGGGSTTILTDLQTLRAELELLDVQGSYGLSKDFEAKLKVTRQSVEKVENGVYGVIVRGRERPAGWMPDVSERREEQESY